ncbi:MAG: hypothetical protein QOH64_3558, partial [Acidimicrobiaceae bacterium]
YLRETGNLVFHVALLLLLAGIGAFVRSRRPRGPA